MTVINIAIYVGFVLKAQQYYSYHIIIPAIVGVADFLRFFKTWHKIS